ncbi:unnamed protein product [Mucor hiemalis]
MSSSPRFWQKLGLGKQSKTSTSSSSTVKSDKQDLNSMHSSISFHNFQDATALDSNNSEKHVKHFSSNLSLRHRASSASLRPQSVHQPSHLQEKQIRRTSYMKPLRKIDPEEYASSYSKLNDTINGEIAKEKLMSSPPLNRISTDLQNQRKPSVSNLPQLQQPSKKQSFIDINNTKNTSIPHTSNRLPTPAGNITRSSLDYQQQQRPTSSNSNGSRLRQPSPAKSLSRCGSNNSLSSVVTAVPKMKSIPKLTQSNSSSYEEDGSINNDARSHMTRSLSNGSNSTSATEKNGKRRSSLEKRKSNKQMTIDQSVPEGDFIVDMLKAELERERASARSLQGQKEAISKDLDYFCTLVDEVTEEKDGFKRKYELEKVENEELKKSIAILQNQRRQQEKLGVSPKGAQTISELKSELEVLQNQATEDQYVYYNNLQCKNDEINKLKSDLKQAQRQIKVLRKTMEQMLKADGKDTVDDNDFSSVDDGIRSRKSSTIVDSDTNGGEKLLLLQSGYHPDNLSVTSGTSANNSSTKPGTNPPSPMPCYSTVTHPDNEYVGGTRSQGDEDEDVLSTTSKEDSYYGNRDYDFLKYDSVDDQVVSLAKRKSAEFSKKLAMSRRRKSQLEEMLGEVDSQLNKVKQKIRPS